MRGSSIREPRPFLVRGAPSRCDAIEAQSKSHGSYEAPRWRAEGGCKRGEHLGSSGEGGFGVRGACLERRRFQ